MVLAACGTAAPGPGIDVDRALSFVRVLASAPHASGTRAAEQIATTLSAELARDGIELERHPVGRIALPAISVLGVTHRRAHVVNVPEPNLVASFGPPGPALLVMAHYDTVHDSPGAVDNAAGVAILVELARELHREPPPRRVLLAFTAAEEIGLAGAEALAKQLGDEVAFAISLDLIGGDGQLVVNGASMLVGYSELAWLASAAERAGVDLGVPPVHRVISRWWPQAERSDHGPFTRRGVRAIHLYNRGHDGEWIDRAYHSGADVPGRVQRAAVAGTAQLLRALIAEPVPAHDGDGFWIPGTRTVVPRAWLVLVEIVLVLFVLGSLVLSRDGLVAFITQERRGDRGPALLVGVLVVAAALLAAFTVERIASGTHPAVWLHAPGRMLLASACVIAGVVGLASRLVARFAAWRGEYRYLVVAIVMLLAIGTAWLVAGAAEIAWVWLVPAAVLAAAPRMRGFGVVAIAAAAVPLVAVLHPDQVREAAWNGFLPVSLPFALLVGGLGIPVIATTAWWLRRRGVRGPMGTLVLGLGCGLLVITGLAVALRTEPTCSTAEFFVFHLACERV